MHDLVIRNGMVVDGTGADRRPADIAIDADLNVIDYDDLTLHPPELVADLPAGGTRLMQAADGYIATIKRGEIIAERGALTGARPGRLQRGRSS